jgi:hypothetical protein
MNQQRYGRESSATGRGSDERSVAPADDISVVPARQADVTPQRTLVPPVAPKNAASSSPLVDDVRPAEPAVSPTTRPSLRAVERPVSGELPRRDPVATAVETVGAAVGWTTGYVKSRGPAEIRRDAERLAVASPALALVAALGFGYLIGSFIRR